MFKKLQWIGCAASCLIAVQAVCAAVNVNKATSEALSGIKGIGSVKAEAIIKERAAHGPYKDADDLAKRVKGLGKKSVAKLQKEENLIFSEISAPAAKPAKAAPSPVRERR